jgi:hypothetical protein
VRAWWRGDAIYFVDDTRGTFAKVPAEGGTPERMFTLADAQLFQIDDVLPDGQSALAEVQRVVSGANRDIVQVDLRTRRASTLISSGYGARYSAAGAILFSRGGNLMASVYDEARAGVAGEPVMVASGVATESLWGISHVASSSTGVLAYVPGSDLSVGRLAWIDGTLVSFAGHLAAGLPIHGLVLAPAVFPRGMEKRPRRCAADAICSHLPPMSRSHTPMRLPRIVELFDHPEFLFEPKIDGLRALAYVSIPERGCDLYRAACALDLEGIVGKWANGTYQTAGRRASWVKFKNPEYSQMEARHELFQASRQGTKARLPQLKLRLT